MISWRRAPAAALGLLLVPGPALAAGHGHLDLPVWSVAPFVALLLCIAVLPLAAGHWWHSNRNKGLVAALVAVPTALYLLVVHLTTEQQALPVLGHELLKYVEFIVLLGSLYVVAGGVV